MIAWSKVSHEPSCCMHVALVAMERVHSPAGWRERCCSSITTAVSCIISDIFIENCDFGRTLLRYVCLMLSQFRLSVVVCLTFVQLTHWVELFGSISIPANSLGARTVCVKIVDRNSRGYRPISTCMQIKRKGYEQELSYRKQIARQLRTQYAEGIYDNPVTLKSRLAVTQGHWKRNH